MFYAFEYTFGHNLTTTYEIGQYCNGRPRTREVAVGVLHSFDEKVQRDRFVDHVNQNPSNPSSAVAITGGKFPVGWKRRDAQYNSFWCVRS